MAASLSTWMHARPPSPAGSAILARHCSTNLRAEVAPLSRSAASEASVGLFGMAVSVSLTLASLVVRSDGDVEWFAGFGDLPRRGLLPETRWHTSAVSCGNAAMRWHRWTVD